VNAIQAIQHAAKLYGIRDWRALAAVANAESGLDPGSIGDSGSSFGLFQLHQGGALGNMSNSKAREYLDAFRNASFAARQIRAMGLHNLTGKAAIAAFVSKFERPANPSGEIARAYAWYQQGNTGTPPPMATTSVGASPDATQASSTSQVPFAFIQDMIDRNAKMFHLPSLNLPMPTQPAQPDPMTLDASTTTTTPAAPAAPSMPGGMVPGAGGYPAGKHGKLIGAPHQGTHTLGNWQSDNAVDIALPVGTPILAATDGVIDSRFGSLGKGGRFAGLRLTVDGHGQASYYAHLSRYAHGIKPGVRVRRGQVIGYSGSANGVAHLHFGVQKGSPYQYVR
jgi:hypothetical protein